MQGYHYGIPAFLLKKRVERKIVELPYKDLYRQLLARQLRDHRIMRNKNMEPSDRILFVLLEYWYPGIYSTLVPIQIWKLAEDAGCKRETVSRFLTAMRDQGYIFYVRETKSAIIDGRVAYSSTVLVQLLSACKEPELLITKNTPRREKKREQDKARKQCHSCGGVIQTRKSMICVSCGEVQ